MMKTKTNGDDGLGIDQSVDEVSILDAYLATAVEKHFKQQLNNNRICEGSLVLCRKWLSNVEPVIVEVRVDTVDDVGLRR